MSSGSKSRKGGKVSRSSSKKMSGQNSSSYDGVYGNPRMVHALLSLMGTKCHAQVKNGGMYSGIFHTFSQNMDLVIGAASKQENATSPVNDVGPVSPRNGQLMDELIFNAKDIVVVKFRDIKLDFAEVSVKSNGDVGLESRFPSANGSEPRALEPWDGGGDTPIDGSLSTGLEDGLESTTNGTNGWGAEDMFRINKEQYGVKSSYDPALPEYTTPLDNDNSHESEVRKARATRLAQEIEGSAAYAKNIELELDDTTTEEEKHSSVRRENSRDQSKFNSRNKGRSRDQNRDQGRDLRGNRSNHSYYQGSGPMPRGSYGAGPGRSNTPTNPSDSPTSPSQAKSFNRPSGMQGQLPPRFSKGGYRDGERPHPRDDERSSRVHESRLHENTTHHSNYTSQSKSQRQGGQTRGNYQRSQPPMSTQDYQPGEAGNTFSGQSTPQSLSRNSSASSVTQQMTPHWNNKSSPASNEERQHPPGGVSAPPGGGNPPLTRNFSSGSNREGNSYSSVLQNTSNPKPAHNVQPSAGPYTDRSYMPLAAPGYRPGMPTTGGPQTAQGARLIFSPKGHSPPSSSMGNNASNQMHVSPVIVPPANQMGQRQLMGMQQRYPSSSVVPGTSTTGPPSVVPSQTSRKLSSEGKGVGLTKASIAAASHTPPPAGGAGISKSSSTGSSKTDIKKELTTFSKNFKLAESKPVTERAKTPPPSTQAKPATAPPAANTEIPAPSKVPAASATKTSRSGSAGQIASQPAPTAPKDSILPQQITPPFAPQSQIIHHPPVSIVRNPSVEGMDMGQPGGVILVPGPLPGPAIIPSQAMMPVSPVNVWPIQEPQPVTSTSAPPQPSINIPSPRTKTTASDVVTVSAATGPFVPPQSDIPPQQTAPLQKVTTPGASSSTVPTTAPTSVPAPSDATSEVAPPAEDSKQAAELNPEAKEFTPRSFAPKTGGIPPQSPTPVAQHQPGSATYYSTTGQVLAPAATPGIPMQYVKTQVPKPEGSVVGVNPHMTPHIHPTTAGHAFIAQGHAYHPHATPLVFAHGTHQQMAAPGQHAVMPPQVPFPNVDQVVYSPPGHHIVQSATPRALQAGYAADAQLFANFQPSQVQIQQQPQPQQQQQQQQQQPPQQQPQQQAQQPQQQSNASYMQQQQRPHSAHTPNPAHITPTSPAATVQPQSGANMAVNPPAQIHPPAQNPVMGSHQNYYHQPILAHPSMHGHIIPSNPHGSYQAMQSRNPGTYMVLSNGGQPISSNPNPPPQHGYMQPVAAASSSAPMQQQYPARHQYQNHHHHPPQLLPGYQQQPAPN